MNFITKFRLRSEIISKLNSGDSKVDVLNDLSQRYGYDSVFNRLLDDIPSKFVKEKYILFIRLLFCVLIGIAVIKGYFLAIGIVKSPTSQIVIMVTTFVAQLVMIWLLKNPSRVGLQVIAGYSVLQFFDYYKGLEHDDIVIKILCITVLVLLLAALAGSVFLYLKFSKDKLHPTTQSSCPAKSESLGFHRKGG